VAKKKIDKLTPEQEKAMVEAREYWFSVGTSTDPAEQLLACEAIRQMYGCVKEARPEVLFISSPAMACYVATLIKDRRSLGDLITKALDKGRLHASIAVAASGKLPQDVVATMFKTVMFMLWGYFTTSDEASGPFGKLARDGFSGGRKIYHAHRSITQKQYDSAVEVIAQFFGDSKGLGFNSDKESGGMVECLTKSDQSVQVSLLFGAIAHSMVEIMREDLWEANLSSALGDALTWFGSNGVYWIGFYDFCGTLVDYKDEDREKLDMHIKLAKSAFWIWPYRNFVLISDRPRQIHWTPGEIQTKRLHKDGGMSASFRDNWGIWSLHGVRVPKWLAETPDSQIDPKKLREINNVEVSREFVRKVGIERICAALKAKSLDKKNPTIGGVTVPYELLELKMQGDLLKYLKMGNPSLPDIIHVERVGDDCKTVMDALAFRNNMHDVEVCEDGEKWYQQGDVLMKPRGAKRLRPWPERIT
jgi:hypothetical protein